MLIASAAALVATSQKGGGDGPQAAEYDGIFVLEWIQNYKIRTSHTKAQHTEHHFLLINGNEQLQAMRMSARGARSRGEVPFSAQNKKVAWTQNGDNCKTSITRGTDS